MHTYKNKYGCKVSDNLETCSSCTLLCEVHEGYVESHMHIACAHTQLRHRVISSLVVMHRTLHTFVAALVTSHVVHKNRQNLTVLFFHLENMIIQQEDVW